MSPSSTCSPTSRTSGSFNNLAGALCIHFGQLARMEDLEEAITCHRQALALRPQGHPNRSFSLGILANALYTRFEQSRSHNDLLDAVKYLSEAKTILPTGHPSQSKIESSLSSIFLIESDVSEWDESLHMMTKAFEVFNHAADHSPANAKDRFHAAVIWAGKHTAVTISQLWMLTPSH